MDAKKETSSGLSSVSGLSYEKRNEDAGSDELESKRAKLQQHLVSDVLAKDDDSNCETRGGVAVSNGSSTVLNPTEPVVTPRDASVSDPMRQWMEMKRNGFLSGPLGSGSTVPSRKRKTKEKKQPKKDQQVDRFSIVAPPSGLLSAEVKPGILRHGRSKEQVYSVLEALIGKANVAGRASELPPVSDHSIPFTNPEQAVEAATVASQWLEFLHQDFSKRLSAVKESRNRVDDTLKAELPILVSSPANQESSTSSGGSGDVSLVKTVAEMKWSAKFEGFKKHLHGEEKELEYSLHQVKDMQSKCNEGLRQMKEAGSCGKDGETSLAVQAAAASIFSTCRYLLSKMKEGTA